MYVKIDEKNLFLFPTNDSLILFIHFVRLANADGEVSIHRATLSDIVKLDIGAAIQTLWNLSLIDNVKGGEDGILSLTIPSIGQWRGGQGTRKTNNSSKPTRTLTIDEQKFNEGMKQTYPRVQSLKNPLTLAEWTDLINKYDVASLKEVLVAMENWLPLLNKCVSAKYTIEVWMKKKRI